MDHTERVQQEAIRRWMQRCEKAKLELEEWKRQYNIQQRRACDAEVENQRLREEYARLERTMEFQGKLYLENHGGSWGTCKYKLEIEHLLAALRAMRGVFSARERPPGPDMHAETAACELADTAIAKAAGRM